MSTRLVDASVAIDIPLPPHGEGWPETAALHLAGTEVEYVLDAPRTARAAGWQRVGPNDWSSSDGGVALRVSLESAADVPDGQLLALSAIAQETVTIRRCAIILRAVCPTPPRYLDRTLRWATLRGSAISNECTPFIVQWHDAGQRRLELRTIRGLPPVRLAWRRGTLELTVELDGTALHPRWSFSGKQPVSTASPARQAQWMSTCTFLLRALGEGANPPAVAARFPAAAEAAFTITDHPAFDSREAFEVFLDGQDGRPGWLGRGLRFTKSVFSVESGPMSRTPAPTLQQPEYRQLAERLAADGSEIAPHGVNESGNVDPARFRDALAYLTSRFHPQTWIDHGLSLEYCYSMGGGDHPEYDLLAELRRHGISVLWAYHDVPANAASSLNLLAPRRWDLPSVLLHSSRHLTRGQVLTAAHYMRSALMARVGGALGHALGTTFSVMRRSYLMRATSVFGKHWAVVATLAVGATGLYDGIRRAARRRGETAAEPFTRGEAIDWGASIYPERAMPFSQVTDDELLLFATVEVLHTRDAYRPAALTRLIGERGLHIGHTYLLNRLPYIAGIFTHAPGSPRLDTGWLDTLDTLSSEVRSGRVWNPTMGELAEWMRAVQCVSVVPVSDTALEVSNPLDRIMRDFTVLLPNTVAPDDVQWNAARPRGTRSWGDWLCVWGDLPAGGSALVRWDHATVRST